MTEFVNLTGHVVTLLSNGDPREFRPSGTIIRLKERELHSEYIDSVRVKTVEYETDGSESWPSPREDTLFIVSYMIAKAATWRDDLVFPFDLIRKPGGVIVGCRSFARVTHHDL